uniref:Uncharacterized protein n=1 Tax=Schistosoma curassoni TaxID=6186 RepID=A0A183L3V4_9TREM
MSVNAFIPEHTTKFVDTIESSNNKHFQVKFWCNTHI